MSWVRAGLTFSPPPVSNANGGEGLGVGGCFAITQFGFAPRPRILPAMLRMGGGEKSVHA